MARSVLKQPLFPVLAAVMLAAGCASSYPVVVDPLAAKAKSSSLVAVSGHVLAPAGIVATGGGNIVATGGGNIVATGGGNIVATGGGNFRALMSLDQAPLAGADVYLADTTGNPLPNTPHATTDATGGYSLGNVPSGFTFVVAVKATDAGKDVALETIATTTDQGATADVSLASTCVTADVVDGRSTLGDIDPVAFAAARDQVAARLDESSKPDVTDRASVLSWVRGQSDAQATVHDALQKLIDMAAKAPSDNTDQASLFKPTPGTPTPAPTPTPKGGIPTHPPIASAAPGQLPVDGVAGVLLDAQSNPVANASLAFKPMHHTETYPPVVTDAHGIFGVGLSFGDLPDSFEVSLNGTFIGYWSLSGLDPSGFPHSVFTPASQDFHIQVYY